MTAVREVCKYNLKENAWSSILLFGLFLWLWDAALGRFIVNLTIKQSGLIQGWTFMSCHTHSRTLNTLPSTRSTVIILRRHFPLHLINNKLDEIVEYLKNIPFSDYGESIEEYKNTIQTELIDEKSLESVSIEAISFVNFGWSVFRRIYADLAHTFQLKVRS